MEAFYLATLEKKPVGHNQTVKKKPQNQKQTNKNPKQKPHALGLYTKQ